MIRIVTLDEFEAPVLKELSRLLYQLFGVGAEVAPAVTVPHGQQEPYDANKLLEALPKVDAFSDDKVLFLTRRKLASRRLPSGEAPTTGLARYDGQLAVVTSAHIKSLDDNVRLLTRYAMHEVGHTYGLHHCLDPRCAMYPQWTPSYPQGDASFCTYCRDQVEAKVRSLKS